MIDRLGLAEANVDWIRVGCFRRVVGGAFGSASESLAQEAGRELVSVSCSLGGPFCSSHLGAKVVPW